MKFDEMTDQERIIAYSRVLTSNDGENLKQMNLYDVGIFLRDLIVQQQEHNKQKELIDKIKATTPLELAIMFHDTYEELAPKFNYETRKDTKEFDENSNNGKLMIAVCSKLLDLIKEYEEK